MPTKGGTFSWVTLGIMLSACVLWLTFGHTDTVAAVVFNVRPGETVYNPDIVWHRVLAVWGAGLVLAITIALAGILLRKHPLDGRSPAAWLHLVASVGTLLAALVIAREMHGRRVTADMWFVFAGGALSLVATFWHARRKSAAPC
ncbi:hypothetical protein [Anaeromyxobacter terrae]|uniref:hypothetical protein n=1 Tax=Anaeromyxobacter terrae TaxID=2925406 RepID=UPI001F57025F|nr:hypothetical protein [Anaeromyxobacter sp. SG22]